MTRRQTGPEIKQDYGLGFAIGPTRCGHGGAYATNMTIDRQRGLILIWMVHLMTGIERLAQFTKP